MPHKFVQNKFVQEFVVVSLLIFYPKKLSQIMWYLLIGWWDNTINSLGSYKELSITQLMTHYLE